MNVYKYKHKYYTAKRTSKVQPNAVLVQEVRKGFLGFRYTSKSAFWVADKDFQKFQKVK